MARAIQALKFENPEIPRFWIPKTLLTGENMISGAHVVIYSRNAETDRALFRDVLRFKSVDAGDGWGSVTRMRLPGGGEIGLYEPRHRRP